DNVSPHSDTTIASASTQEARIKTVVLARMPMVIVAAIITIAVVFIFGGGGEVTQNEVTENANPSGLLMLASFAVLLTAVFLNRHIVEAFIWAIISAVILGMINNNIALLDMFHIPTESGASSGIVEDGISSIVNPLVFVIIILAVTQIMIASGAIDKIL